MKSRPMPAEVTPPGDYLKEELEARGLTQQELADIVDRPPRVINEIIQGKRAITPQTALELSHALGSSPQSWLALESDYQLSRAEDVGDAVRRKATLYALYPVRELLRRGWIEPTNDLESLEHRFKAFFGVASINDRPRLRHAAKKTHAGTEPSVEQLSWLFRVKQLGSSLPCPAYSRAKLVAAVTRLEKLRAAADSVAEVPEILRACGVQLIFVEPIATAKIDGACLWARDKPVIGMSLRFDRIDNFWFVLRHEIEHVLRGDGKEVPIIDADVGASEQDEAERIANAAAAEFCFPQATLKRFVSETSPYFSEEKIVNLARVHSIHPGLLVGQLQRTLDRHDLLRKHQVKVRSLLIGKAPTDGWGVTAAPTTH